MIHAAGHGPVVCSQMYRIAAESAAAHAATNMRTGEVGCMVAPPEDQASGAGTAVTYMTHQTLLRVLAADPLLARYGAVVVDEADDGMLLTAAVLSCVKAVVARRPELRVVICIQGTMYNGEGAVHNFFPDAVHLWFRTRLGDLVLQDFLSLPVTDYVAASVHTVCSIHSTEPPGDVLVFLPTCADIEAAERLLAARAMPGLVTRCLHDGLPVDLIDDVLSPAPDGKRKVVLATDVANSAVFVEGIKYIVDSGYLCTDNALPSLTGASPPAQMFRALKVAVRLGYHIKRRGNKGKCFCLYTLEEWRGMLQTSCSSLRARTNDVNSLAGVVLVLKDLGIISGSVGSFNFVVPPRQETLRWAVEALEAAGAVGLDGEVTEDGRRMASRF